jgi:hypothetical protein
LRLKFFFAKHKESSCTSCNTFLCPKYSSCTEAMGESSLSMVRKAARLAVYEEIMIRVKNHQKLATVRVDTARGRKSQPWRLSFNFFLKILVVLES